MNARPSAGGPPAALHALPAFSDNYIWLVRQGSDATVVDPGQAAPVLDFLRAEGLRLRAILLTHHHADHVGGVNELSQAFDVTIYGPAHETLPRCDIRLGAGDAVRLPELGLDLSVLDVPGHTAGHIAYWGRAAGRPVAFCGDTLFAGGCGRLFEGTPAQMHDSLGQLAALPPDTQVCCAHEYTLANLRWALAVEPGNRALQEWHERACLLRQADRPTLPSSIALELDTNPFLRVAQADVALAASRWSGRALKGPVEVFAALREWKNQFK